MFNWFLKKNDINDLFKSGNIPDDNFIIKHQNKLNNDSLKYLLQNINKYDKKILFSDKKNLYSRLSLKTLFKMTYIAIDMSNK